MSQFKDKIILVTGGTSGIGLTTAIEFAYAGAQKVIVCGRHPEKWRNSIIDRIGVKDGVIEYYRCDVRVEEEVRDMIEYMFDEYKRVDVFVNNAGIQTVDDGDLTKMEFASKVGDDGSISFVLPGRGECRDEQRTPTSSSCESPIATSIFGLFYCLKWELHFLYERQFYYPCSIINTASRNSILPSPTKPLYDASKFFVDGLTKSMAVQVAQKCEKDGREMIRLNCVSPGFIPTPLSMATYGRRSLSQVEDRASKGTPMGRTGTREEVANVILFLASPSSSYMTGTNIPVDGGYTACPIVE